MKSFPQDFSQPIAFWYPIQGLIQEFSDGYGRPRWIVGHLGAHKCDVQAAEGLGRGCIPSRWAVFGATPRKFLKVTFKMWAFCPKFEGTLVLNVGYFAPKSRALWWQMWGILPQNVGHSGPDGLTMATLANRLDQALPTYPITPGNKLSVSNKLKSVLFPLVSSH